MLDLALIESRLRALERDKAAAVHSLVEAQAEVINLRLVIMEADQEMEELKAHQVLPPIVLHSIPVQARDSEDCGTQSPPPWSP